MDERELDIVIFGATGFTGRKAARYLMERGPRDLRLGIAGRDPDKLKALAASLPAEPTVIVANSRDTAAVHAMCARTKVVLAMAGPFAKYGTPVVEGCIAEKTHYLDITGETPWVRSLIDRFHAQALREGTTLIPFCGYDSVPSDLGTWLAVRALKEGFGEDTVRATAMQTGRGGFNGGSLATMLSMAEPEVVKCFAELFLLNPGFTPSAEVKHASQDSRGVFFHKETGRWLAPFFMAPINSRVVRRSAMLHAEAGHGYGPDFVYTEHWRAGSRFEALAMLGTMASLNIFAGTRLGGALIAKLGPAPGDGPSERSMDQGFFKCLVLAEGKRNKVMAEVSGGGDPGNRATVRFCSEAAILMARHPDSMAARGGVLTPAFALGQAYLERLRAEGVTAK